MGDFYSKQWADLCQRTRQSAEYYSEKLPQKKSEVQADTEQFCALDPPSGYQELLQRTAEACEMALNWSGEKSVAMSSE